jgi:UPF0716 family protein affecting phage T7 exclusion
MAVHLPRSAIMESTLSVPVEEVLRAAVLVVKGIVLIFDGWIADVCAGVCDFCYRLSS